MIELTEQQQGVLKAEPEPHQVIDPGTRTTYVLVRKDLYDRLQVLLGDETVYTTAEMLDRVMAEDDAHDPYLAELQQKYGPGPSGQMSPVTILREQAQLIAPKTRGLIEGLVTTDKAADMFLQQFFLVVPTLGNYSYRMLFVRHPLQLYPAEMVAEVSSQNFTAANPGEFIEQLKSVLNSDQTKQIVGILLAQAEGAPAYEPTR